MKRWMTAIAALIVFGLIGFRTWTDREQSPACGSDFAAFYVAARSVFCGELYSAAPHARFVASYGCPEAVPSLRPPFEAVLLSPLGRLPFETALGVWLVIGIATMAALVALSPMPNWFALAVTAVSPAVATALYLGQDTPLLLLAAVIAVRLRASGPMLAAGGALALCFAKPHLFVFVPVLLAARKEWRMLQGLALGGGCLAAVSFLAAGWNWPLGWLRAALTPAVHPHPWSMPNLHGMLINAPGWLEWTLTLAVAGVVPWAMSRAFSFERAFMIALGGGLLVGRHAYLPDLCLLLPAAVAIPLEAKSPRWLKAAVLLPLLPLPPGFWVKPGYTLVPQVLVLMAFLGLVYEALSFGLTRRAVSLRGRLSRSTSGEASLPVAGATGDAVAGAGRGALSGG